jgi:hypothetical protein
LAIVCLGLVASSARADFIVETNFSADEKFFISDHYTNVSSFTGNVGGQHSGPLVTVTAGTAVDTTVDTGAGYATIKPDTGILSSLKFTPADTKLFEDFSFRGQLTDAGSVTVTVVDQGGSTTITFDNNGQPFAANTDFGRLGVIATDGDTILSVTISSAGFKEVKQVEFSEVDPTPTPEPASLTMLGIGTIGLIGYGWRRRK